MRPQLIVPTGDLCAFPGCDDPAEWAASFGKGCGLHAATEHVPTPDGRHPAKVRIERARALMGGGR